MAPPVKEDPTICQFNIRTSKALKARLDAEAFESRRSLQDLSRTAIEIYLDALDRKREREQAVIAAGEAALGSNEPEDEMAS